MAKCFACRFFWEIKTPVGKFLLFFFLTPPPPIYLQVFLHATAFQSQETQTRTSVFMKSVHNYQWCIYIRNDAIFRCEHFCHKTFCQRELTAEVVSWKSAFCFALDYNYSIGPHSLTLHPGSARSTGAAGAAAPPALV